MTLQVGEIVRLKSGGPAMTVMASATRAGPSVVECAWFTHEHAYATASFPPWALERVTLAQPGARPMLAASGPGSATS